MVIQGTGVTIGKATAANASSQGNYDTQQLGVDRSNILSMRCSTGRAIGQASATVIN